MVDPRNTYFNDIYDALYLKVKAYVIAKCSNLSDVEDIMQETFTEFYNLIVKKGISYTKNAEAMVMHIAKTKIYRHYTLREKLKNLIPLYNKNKEDEEYGINIASDINIEENFINEDTVREVWKYILSKARIIQKIFALYYYCDKSIKEISLELKISESNVKHKLYRTLEEIRCIYKKEGN